MIILLLLFLAIMPLVPLTMSSRSMSRRSRANNLRHHAVIDCKYQRFKNSYCFYMTIEAIEEGILGVYESIVECYATDGRTRLVHFILTNRRPT
nr:hypothetical protein [Tanacetum cinerariifolium]